MVAVAICPSLVLKRQHPLLTVTELNETAMIEIEMIETVTVTETEIVMLETATETEIVMIETATEIATEIATETATETEFVSSHLCSGFRVHYNAAPVVPQQLGGLSVRWRVGSAQGSARCCCRWSVAARSSVDCRPSGGVRPEVVEYRWR